jgi:drug/metabolite transporter (DMT)-like permease
MLFGAMTEIAIDGATEGTPTRGMGFGAGAGVLAAGIVATQVEISASRMLLLDLSVSLGGLGGAALASPLLFVEESHDTHTRLWLGAVAVGAVAGGFIGWYFTDKDDKVASAVHVVPYATRTQSPYGDSFDVGLVGAF